MANNLNLETVIKYIDKFALNYDIEPRKGYATFIFDELNEERFTNEDFVIAIKTIMRDNSTTFGKMPNLAMFIEARPQKQYKSTLLEHQLFNANQLRIENNLTPEQKKKQKEAMDKAIDKSLKKYRGCNMFSNKQKKAQSKDWEEFKKNHPLNSNTIQEGVLSPQLQKLKSNRS